MGNKYCMIVVWNDVRASGTVIGQQDQCQYNITDKCNVAYICVYIVRAFVNVSEPQI